MIERQEAEQILGERCFGYGRWDAPYWFIGPEQGQHRDEKGDLVPRCEAFLELEKNGLCDSKGFHERIRQTRFWQKNKSGYIPLQFTWRRLMRTLFAFKDGVSVDLHALRNYQATMWGRSSGETCVVELSGLPANSMQEMRDRKSFRDTRFSTLIMNIERFQPKFVVVYGKTQHDLWKNWLSRMALPSANENIWKFADTKIALKSTPKGQTDGEWTDLGFALRSA